MIYIYGIFIFTIYNISNTRTSHMHINRYNPGDTSKASSVRFKKKNPTNGETIEMSRICVFGVRKEFSSYMNERIKLIKDTGLNSVQLIYEQYYNTLKGFNDTNAETEGTGNTNAFHDMDLDRTSNLKEENTQIVYDDHIH